MAEKAANAQPGSPFGAPAEPHTIIVFEREPRWYPELQRQFVGEEVRIRWCNELRDVGGHLVDVGSAVVVFDFDESPGECLQVISRISAGIRPVPCICVGSRQTADLEWAVREVGGLAFYPDGVTGERLAALCRRQWRIPRWDADLQAN